MSALLFIIAVVLAFCPVSLWWALAFMALAYIAVHVENA